MFGNVDAADGRYGRVLRAFLPGVSATLTPAANGWRIRYRISRGLVRPGGSR
jgi:hypothetical protein